MTEPDTMPDLNQRLDAVALPPGKRKRKQKRIRTWDSSLLSAEIGPYVFVALTDSGALKAEGRRMQHCVANDIDICRPEVARIFPFAMLSAGNRSRHCR